MLSVQALTTSFKNQSLGDKGSLVYVQVDHPGHKCRHKSESQVYHSISVSPDKTFKTISFHEPEMVIRSETCTAIQDACTKPPHKRNCRSMSIPSAGDFVNTEFDSTECFSAHKRCKLRKPVPMRTVNTNPKNKCRHHSYPSRAQFGLVSQESQSPPNSPVTRPSSASSGFFESSLTSLTSRVECSSSIQSLGTVWSAKSMPSVMESANPDDDLLMRCQSQPCVLRLGTKRRRSDDIFGRPCLNFSKMTQSIVSTPAHGLQPIASSPPENDVLLCCVDAKLSQISHSVVGVESRPFNNNQVGEFGRHHAPDAFQHSISQQDDDNSFHETSCDSAELLTDLDIDLIENN